MSKGKHKKRHSSSRASRRDDQLLESLPLHVEEKAKKRMKPLARNLLLGDLVLMAVCQLVMDKGPAWKTFSDVGCIVGILLLLAALYLQFVKKPATGGPRLK